MTISGPRYSSPLRNGGHAQERILLASFWVLGLFLAVALIVGDRFAPAGRTIIKIEGLDAVCYYNTAHSILFDKDFDLTNQNLRFPPIPSRFIYTHPETGRPTSPFAIGYPLLQIPFLFAGHLLTSLAQGESDGYSYLCMAAWFLENIFYLSLGSMWSLAFAVQYRLDLIPKNDRLTFNELTTDKFHITRALHRKRMTDKARIDLKAGRSAAAVERLLDTSVLLGEDRESLKLLILTLRDLGKEEDALAAEQRLQELLDSRLY